MTVPLITTVSQANSQATITGANFGSAAGRVYLGVRNANNNAALVPEFEVSKESISQWSDRQILLRLPERVLSSVNTAREAAKATAKSPGTSSTFGVRYDYHVQPVGGKDSNLFTHSEFFINVNEGIGISAQATK